MTRRSMLAVLFAVGGLVGCAAGREPVQLRVVTYNIHVGKGLDGTLDLERIAAVIRRLEPDLVALEEVDRNTRRTGHVDQAATLAGLTNMHCAYGRAIEHDGGEYGVAILARWPLRAVSCEPLPFTPGHEARVALAALVRPDPALPEVRFVATHWQHDAADDRLAEAQRINALFAADDETSTILAGDLNAPPTSPALRVLAQQWCSAALSQSQLTYPADVPARCIDYVLFRPSAAWRVVATSVIEEPVASDHRPVLAVLEWTCPR